MLSTGMGTDIVVKLEGHKYVISDESIRHESRLGGGNKKIQGRFKTVHNCFRPYFIKHITKANRSKISHAMGILNFGDKHNISIVQGSRQRHVVKEIKRARNHIVTNNIPILMKKKGRKTIRAWGFKGGHARDSFDYLFIGKKVGK